MHLFIPWWIFAMLPALIGSIVAIRQPAPSSWYDIASPFVASVAFVGGLLISAAIVLGHYL